MIKDNIDWKVCSNCGFLQYQTHLRCVKCKFDKFANLEPLEPCKLLTYTVLTSPPTEFRNQTFDIKNDRDLLDDELLKISGDMNEY